MLFTTALLKINKKTLQLNAKRPLADSPHFIVNKFEHDGWRGIGHGPGPCTVRTKLNMFDLVWETRAGALYRGVDHHQGSEQGWTQCHTQRGQVLYRDANAPPPL